MPIYSSGKVGQYGAEGLSNLRSLSSLETVTPDQLATDLGSYIDAFDGYKNHTSKNLIANLAVLAAGKKYPECGADDGQAYCLVKVPIAVACYAGAPDNLSNVDETIRAHQKNDKAVRYGVAAALLLENITKGSSVKDTLAWAVAGDSPIEAETRRELADAAAAVPPSTEPADAAARLGASCALPGALLMSAHILRFATGYEDAVHRNILACCDQCSRGALIGGCFAAQDPAAWAAKVSQLAPASSRKRGARGGRW
jgi:hypothetical protein